MNDVPVAQDDARQAGQREAVKETVQDQVNTEIVGHAASASRDEEAEVGQVAAKMRSKAIDETARGERTIGQARVAARGSQFIDYAFYVVYSLLGIRLVLALIAAASSNGFVRLIRAVTDPFYAPFRGIVPSPSAEGGYTLVGPILIAVVVYALVHAAINGLLRMVAHRKTVI